MSIARFKQADGWTTSSVRTAPLSPELKYVKRSNAWDVRVAVLIIGARLSQPHGPHQQRAVPTNCDDPADESHPNCSCAFVAPVTMCS